MGQWNPNYIERAIDERQSSTNVVIVETDIGQGYAKFIGNPAGEHCLASEYVCTQLAEWLGLPTLDYGLVGVDENLDSIRLYNGSMARSGPAFITRLESGDVWDGTKKQLSRVSNPDDISRLVVFDTWVMNRDRKSRLMHLPNNVLLSTEQSEDGKVRIVAIDHTHCLTDTTGNSIDLNQLGSPDVKEVFGLFTEFRPFLDRTVIRSTAERLSSLDRSIVASIVKSIPVEWGVPRGTRQRIVNLLLKRAARTADAIENLLLDPVQTQKSLDLGLQEGDK